MNLEMKIRELMESHFADLRRPNIAGFVDQLFLVAADRGSLSGTFAGGVRLRFAVPDQPTQGTAPVAAPVQAQSLCVVEHPAAKQIVRMICARLGALCRERSGADVAPYGDRAVIAYDILPGKRWGISFTNTPDRQEFAIEAL